MPNQSPRAVAATQATTLNKAYPAAIIHCDAFAMASISAEKVENVVNPPQKPTIPMNMSQLCEVSDMKKPISSDPAIFTVRVDTGNAVENGNAAKPTETR